MMTRIKFFVFTLLVLVTSGMHVMAQTNPCGGSDEDGTTCPLDTWVWILVIAVPALAIWQWYKQQQTFKRA